MEMADTEDPSAVAGVGDEVCSIGRDFEAFWV